MRLVQVSLISFAGLALLAALAYHTGLFGWTCERNCAILANWPYSPIIGAAGLLAVVSMAVALKMGSTTALGALAAGAAVVGLGLIPVMRSLGALCAPCLVVTATFVSLGLTAVPLKWLRATAIPVFAVSQFFLMWLWYDETQVVPLIPFEPRPWEAQLVGPEAYVLFTDPNCPACKRVERDLEAYGRALPLYRRWHLIAGQPDSSLKVAAAIETLASQDPELALEVVRAVAAVEGVFEEGDLLNMEWSDAQRSSIRTALDQPSPRALTSIARDGHLAKQARVQSVPAFFLVSPKYRGTDETKLVPVPAESFFAVLSHLASARPNPRREERSP